MKIKRIFTIALLTLMLVLTAPVRAEAATSGSCGENATWKLSNGTLTISGTGPMTDFNGQSDVPWYDSLDSITTAVVGEGITTLGNWFCCWAENLTSVSLPSTLTEIDTSAFYQCALLKEIDIPDGVTKIGYNCLAGCDSLTEIDLPDGLTELGTQVFYGSKGLTSIVIPDSVTSIGTGAFSNCESLTSVTLPSGLTTIPYNVFSWSGITSLTIPESVTTIGGNAFYNCTKLKEITIPAGVTTIGATAFKYSAIKEITLPEGITTINDSVFCGCSALEKVTLPDSVTGIGASAFSSCRSLKEIAIPSSVTSISNSAFSSCSLTDITIPASVTSIGDSAFSSCAQLSGITFEGDAPAFGASVFNGVTANGYYAISNETWTEEVLSADYGGTITWVACCDDGNHVYEDTVVAPTCTEQGYTNHQCVNCQYSYADSYVDTVHDYNAYFTCRICGKKNYTYSGSCGKNLGRNVNWILSNDGTLLIYGSGAMHDYSIHGSAPWYRYSGSITRIEVMDGVTHIGDYMFYYLSKCESITLPPSVTSIGIGNFNYHNNLTDVYISDLTAWCGITFEANNSQPFSMAENLYLNGELVTNLVIPEGTTAISTRAFYGCESITSVVFPKSLTSVGNTAFSNCTSLKTVFIPDGLTSIGDSAFSGCKALSKITFKGDAPAFGASVFSKVTANAHYPESNSTWTSDVMQNYGGTITWIPSGKAIPGDVNGDDTVDEEDVIYLLWYTLFPGDYEIYGDADFTGDGNVDEDDVIYLLWYTLFPEDYPL